MLRTGPLLGIALGALLIGFVLSQVTGDSEAPGVVVELDRRVAAGLPFSVFVSASEPVTLELTYGVEIYKAVSQDFRVTLLAREGLHSVSVLVTDGLGNRASVEETVLGVPAPTLEMESPDRVAIGDPFVVNLAWTGPSGGAATVETVEVMINRIAVPAFITSDSSGFALGSVPLDYAEGLIAVVSSLVDEFGRTIQIRRRVSIDTRRRSVVDLNLSAGLRALLSQTNRDLEAAVLADAFSRGREERLWLAPFQNPLPGRITSGFGVPRRYATAGAATFHLGTDIAAENGAEIRAANAGEIAVAGFFPIKGGLVVIDHGGGLSSLYFHQSRILVEEGERVDRGQVIGEVGSTGLATGPHLHWEMRLLGIPTNPIAWIGMVLPSPPVDDP